MKTYQFVTFALLLAVIAAISAANFLRYRRHALMLPMETETDGLPAMEPVE